MTQEDKELLKKEIDYVFESGANEIRILEMVTMFFDSRSMASMKLLENTSPLYRFLWGLRFAENLEIRDEAKKMLELYFPN